jgi:hypothetical protein
VKSESKKKRRQADEQQQQQQHRSAFSFFVVVVLNLNPNSLVSGFIEEEEVLFVNISAE